MLLNAIRRLNLPKITDQLAPGSSTHSTSESLSGRTDKFRIFVQRRDMRQVRGSRDVMVELFIDKRHRDASPSTSIDANEATFASLSSASADWRVDRMSIASLQPGGQRRRPSSWMLILIAGVCIVCLSAPEDTSEFFKTLQLPKWIALTPTQKLVAAYILVSLSPEAANRKMNVEPEKFPRDADPTTAFALETLSDMCVRLDQRNQEIIVPLDDLVSKLACYCTKWTESNSHERRTRQIYGFLHVGQQQHLCTNVRGNLWRYGPSSDTCSTVSCSKSVVDTASVVPAAVVATTGVKCKDCENIIEQELIDIMKRNYDLSCLVPLLENMLKEKNVADAAPCSHDVTPMCLSCKRRAQDVAEIMDRDYTLEQCLTMLAEIKIKHFVNKECSVNQHATSQDMDSMMASSMQKERRKKIPEGKPETKPESVDQPTIEPAQPAEPGPEKQIMATTEDPEVNNKRKKSKSANADKDKKDKKLSKKEQRRQRKGQALESAE